jgi:hypothetical protein
MEAKAFDRKEIEKDVRQFDQEITPLLRRLLSPFVGVYFSGTILILWLFGMQAAEQWLFGVGTFALVVWVIFSLSKKNYPIAVFAALWAYYFGYRALIYFDQIPAPVGGHWLTIALAFLVIATIPIIENLYREIELHYKMDHEAKNGYADKVIRRNGK